MGNAALKILVVDEEQLLLWAIKRAGQLRDIRISTASTTEDALTCIASHDFDLFVINFDLRNNERNYLLKMLDVLCPYVPIVIMTTSAINGLEINNEIRTIRQRGAWHLLEKPFRLEQLLSIFEQIFTAQRCTITCLPSMENERRTCPRRAYVAPISFSFKRIKHGELQVVQESGIMTDIGEYGVGLLSQSRLDDNLVVSFDLESNKQHGVVVWSQMIESNTYRSGLRIYCKTAR